MCGTMYNVQYNAVQCAVQCVVQCHTYNVRYNVHCVVQCAVQCAVSVLYIVLYNMMWNMMYNVLYNMWYNLCYNCIMCRTTCRTIECRSAPAAPPPVCCCCERPHRCPKMKWCIDVEWSWLSSLDDKCASIGVGFHAAPAFSPTHLQQILHSHHADINISRFLTCSVSKVTEFWFMGVGR